jgi:WD40 repeat protein
VLGLTCTNGNSLAFITAANCVIYPAGCTIVLYYVKLNQYSHIINPSKKPISCVCSSPDDKLIAYGECGHSPCVHVWDVSTSSPNRVAALQGHKFGISCLCFSPNLRYLISVGYQHDQTINIWDWKQGTKIASNKITSKVTGPSLISMVTVTMVTHHRSMALPIRKMADILLQLDQGEFAIGTLTLGRGPRYSVSFA